MSYADDQISQEMQEAAMARINKKPTCQNCNCCDVNPHRTPCNKCNGFSQWRPIGMTFTQWNQIAKQTLGKFTVTCCNNCVHVDEHRPTFHLCVQCENQSNWEERKMSKNVDGTRVVMVKFPRECGGWSGEYAFKTDLNLQVGDDVLVDVTNKGATLAKVTQADVESSKATRWVIQKVDYEAHKARIVREAKLVALRERMEKRLEVLQKNEIFAKWAEKDPEMAQLIAEYNATIDGASAATIIMLHI